MDPRTRKADEKLLTPGVFVGRHPDSGVLHRLTITTDGRLFIERKPYVSTNPDSWTQTFRDIVTQAEAHLFLIQKIKQNPAQWPK